jgi:hypothetical protein
VTHQYLRILTSFRVYSNPYIVMTNPKLAQAWPLITVILPSFSDVAWGTYLTLDVHESKKADTQLEPFLLLEYTWAVRQKLMRPHRSGAEDADESGNLCALDVLCGKRELSTQNYETIRKQGGSVCNSAVSIFPATGIAWACWSTKRSTT